MVFGIARLRGFARSTLLPLFLYAAVPNLLWGFLASGMSFSTPLVNIDFLAWGLVAAGLSPVIGATGAGLLMLVAALAYIAPVFRFEPLAFLYAGRELVNLDFDFNLLPPEVWLGLPAAIFLSAAAAYFASKPKRSRDGPPRLLSLRSLPLQSCSMS